MDKYIALIDKTTNVCTGVTILQEVPPETEQELAIEVPHYNFRGRKYINGEWSDGVVDLGDLPQIPQPPTLEKIQNMLESIENANLQFQMEWDARATDLEMSLKGGE